MMLCLTAFSAFARDVTVTNKADLHQAFQTARAGDRLLLKGGSYGTLTLWSKGKVKARFDGPVTVQSADPADPAVFTALELNGARHVVFRHIVFDYRAAHGTHKERPFEVKNSSRITFAGCLFDGDIARGAGPKADGFGAGLGLAIRGSDNITLDGNRLRNFYRGLTVGESRNIVVRGNDLSGMRSDGMNFVKVTQLMIENNHLHDFRRNMAAGDHADMIQFWTNKARTPTTQVTIRGNILNIGDGDHTQSIFMRNEAVDSQNRGRAMFYRDVVIEHNVIINGHLHGITIGETDGLRIRHNTLIRAPRKGSTQKGRGPEHWAPRIKVAAGSVNVTLRDNIAAGIAAPSAGWDVADNLIIQDVARMAPNHYNQVFVRGLTAAPYPLDAFVYRTGGPAAVRAGLGAARLRAR